MANALANLINRGDIEHRGNGSYPKNMMGVLASQIAMNKAINDAKIPVDIRNGEEGLRGGLELATVGGIPISATDILPADLGATALAKLALAGKAALAGKSMLGGAPAIAGMIAGRGAKTEIPAKTEYELAHEVAQRNAAMPVEQGGLGLHPDNTAMDRAKAMGFNTPAYHGTLNANQSEFTPSKGGELGAGTYITDDPNLASEFARTAYGAPFPESSGVYPLLTKGLQEIPRNDWVAQRGEAMDALRAANNGEWEGRFYNQAMDDMRNATEASGKHGWYTPGVGGINQGVVFDPKNIRSRFAAFDPMQRKSANLLAGGAAAAVGLGALSPNESEAAPMSINDQYNEMMSNARKQLGIE